MKPHTATITLLLSISMAACAGNSLPSGGSSALHTNSNNALAPMLTATPVPAPTLPATLSLSSGRTYGAPNMFAPTHSDTSSGGLSQPVDGLDCAPSMIDDQFHVHSYLGVLVNGQWYAVPYGVGMYLPVTPVNGFVNYAKCFYNIHTHDQTGYIHQEIAWPASMTKHTQAASLFTLGNLMDVWGQTLTANNFGPFTGVVRVYTAQAPAGSLYASNYALFTGDPNSIQLYSHKAIWIEVGPPYIAPTGLPIVRFYTQY